MSFFRSYIIIQTLNKLENNHRMIHIVKICRTNANLEEMEVKKEVKYKFDVNIMFIYNELARKDSIFVEKCTEI